jgi:hypothetical protein
MFMGLPDPHPDPLVRDTDPDPDPASNPDPYDFLVLSMKNDVNVTSKSNRQKNF